MEVRHLDHLNLTVRNFEETVDFTVDWYRAYYEQSAESAKLCTHKQIEQYTALAQRRQMTWTR